MPPDVGSEFVDLFDMPPPQPRRPLRPVRCSRDLPLGSDPFEGQAARARLRPVKARGCSRDRMFIGFIGSEEEWPRQLHVQVVETSVGKFVASRRAPQVPPG